MTSIQIDEQALPCLDGKTAIVTGGADGIGWATTQLLHQKGAHVHILDLQPPSPDKHIGPRIHYHHCDVSNWASVRDAFAAVGGIDMAFANAGIRELSPFLATDANGEALEPDYSILDVNLRGVLNTIKLAWTAMKARDGGSIVLTSSNLAYAASPWQPLYSATKLALLGLVRSLRVVGPQDGISISAVAASPTSTSILPASFHERLVEAGIPVSRPETVALALVYSAVARAERRVESYGRDEDGEVLPDGRWNGRVIYISGEQFTEVEELLADLSSSWLGEENKEVARTQQRLIDRRQPSA